MLLKKVLLITYHFPPSAASGSFRLLGFARHLPRTGWQPLVVAPPQMPWEPVDPQLAWEVPAEAVVSAVPYPASAPKILRYFAQNAIWLPHAWSACTRMIREYRPDVILTSGPPHCVHLLGHYLKRSFGVPWVADFRDPWISDGTNKKLGLLQRWALRWERAVFQNANLILANAPNACQMFQETYPEQRAKIVTLTNGFDPNPEGRKNLPPRDGAVRMLHAGELYAGRDPLPLLEALAEGNRRLAANPRYELHILGRNDAGSIDFPHTLQQRGWSDFVQLHGQCAYQESLDAMEWADLLILFDSPGRKNGVPAKLYEYFRAGRPILALAEPDGDTAAILRASGVLHRVASPRDAAGIGQALRALVAEMRATEEISDPARLRRFTREHLAESLAGMLDTVAGFAHGPSLRVDGAERVRSPHALASIESAREKGI